MKERKMNKQIAGAIVIICILGTFGTTYAVVNAYMEQEISNLEAQIEELNSIIENYMPLNPEFVSQMNKLGGFWNLTEASGNTSNNTIFERLSFFFASNPFGTSTLVPIEGSANFTFYKIHNNTLLFYTEYFKPFTSFTYEFINNTTLVITKGSLTATYNRIELLD